MIHILVTGAEGQLGKCIQKIAHEYPDFNFKFYNSKTLDITKPQEVLEVFSKEMPHYCLNFAAYTNVEQAEKTPEPAFAVNSEGARNIAEACEKNNTILVHISTDYVFDGEKGSPYLTSDKTNPINEYGKSKLKGEHYITRILETYFIIRTSWLYSEFGKNFYKSIVENAKTESVLKVTDKQTGSPTNANNLAKYVIKLIEKSSKNYGIYHFTDGERMTWYDFARKIVIENKLKTKVEPISFNTIAKRPIYSVLMLKK